MGWMVCEHANNKLRYIQFIRFRCMVIGGSFLFVCFCFAKWMGVYGWVVVFLVLVCVYRSADLFFDSFFFFNTLIPRLTNLFKMN